MANHIHIGASQPCAANRRSGRNGPGAKPGRNRRFHRPDIDRRDDQRLTRKTGVQEVDQAVRKDDLPADVSSSDEDQGLSACIAHLSLDNPGKMRVTPIVHVVVRRACDLTPVDRWVTKQHAKSLGRWEHAIDGANVREHLLVHRQRPDVADLCRVLPCSPQGVSLDSSSSDVAIDNILITGVARLDDDVVHLAGKAALTNQARQEAFRFSVAVHLTERDEGIAIERFGDVLRSVVWREIPTRGIDLRCCSTTSRTHHDQQDWNPTHRQRSVTAGDLMRTGCCRPSWPQSCQRRTRPVPGAAATKVEPEPTPAWIPQTRPRSEPARRDPTG